MPATRKRIVAASIVAAALAGCAGLEVSPQPNSAVAPAVYSGILPCADCAGIRTELRLYAEQPSGRPIRYELSETYLATRDGDRAFEKSGRWTLLRGSASDPNATVYQLDFDRPATQRDFLRVGDDELRLLDRRQHEIPSAAPHSLYRVARPKLM